MKQRLRESVVVGFNPIEAVADVATSAWDGATDVVTSVIDTVPGMNLVADGIDEVTGPVGDFVKGPLRDFSRTTVGEVIMRAFSVAVSMTAYMLSPAIGPYVLSWVGPTLAFAAWSIPGLAKGERFDEAMVKEFAYRVAYVISVFSKEAGDAVAKALGPTLNTQLQKALDYGKNVVEKKFPGLNTEEALSQLGITPDSVLENMGLTPKQLADRLGIREDMALMALAWMKRDERMLTSVKNYDPITGRNIYDLMAEKRKREVDAYRAAQLTELLKITDPCAAYVVSIRMNRGDVSPVFKRQCEEAKIRQTWLAQKRQELAAMRNPCDAYVESVKLGQASWSELLKKKCADFKTTLAVSSFVATKEEASAKVTRNYALLAAGILLAAGGATWYLRKRGK
jgi:hypothetical protein